MTRPELVVVGAAEEAAAVAAERTATILAEAIAARGRADWATTGGSAAQPLYEQLSTPPRRNRVDWTRVHVWWGDDRFVPLDHPLSNAMPFDQVMVRAGARERGAGARPGLGEGAVEIPGSQIHVVPVGEAIANGGGASFAAHRYAQLLREQGPGVGPEGWPVFDLVILGVGPDGHILSVFPGSQAWDTRDWAVAIPAPSHVEPHVERVTLHPAIVTAARNVLVISTGSSKAEMLARALSAQASPRDVPAAAAARTGATWILDSAAASRIPA